MARLASLTLVACCMCGTFATGSDSKKNLLVVGSANWDTTVQVERLPSPGETVLSIGASKGGGLSSCPGGKGLNQAVAAARLSNSKFACRVGNDGLGKDLLRALEAEGVEVWCGATQETPSGQGFVVVAASSGEVLSVVVSGANAKWEECDEKEADDVVRGVSACLLQREIPTEANLLFAAAAKRAGAIVFLDAGGEDGPLDAELAKHVDWLCPNLPELCCLAGRRVSEEAEVVRAAEELRDEFGVNVLVTLGASGSLVVMRDGGIERQQAAKAERVVDQTAAGDAFRAAFAVAMCVDKKSLSDSLKFASAAGAVAVSKLGAAIACPTRTEIQSRLRGGATTQGDDFSSCPWKFASRLNSMKDRRDLCEEEDPNTTLGWIKRQGQVEGLDLVDFNYPQHLSQVSVEDVRAALKAAKLKCGAVCLRYPSNLFRKGSFTHPDRRLRGEAVSLTLEAADWAKQLGADEVCVWSAFDGYDYSLQVDYDEMWKRMVDCFREVCDARPDIKFSLEFKPTDENTRFFAVPSTGAAVLLARDVDRSNFGLTLDIGHMLAAGENPAQSVALASNKLFGVQLNDGYQRIGAEDGLMFGSVHHLAALEFVFWLRRSSSFEGHVYFDTFPRNEDPVREAEYNIRKVKRLYKKAAELERIGIQHTVFKNHDAMAALELLEQDEERRQ